MSESDTSKPIATKNKREVSVGRFSLMVFVPVVYSLVVGYFVPDTIGPGRPVIPLVIAAMAMIFLTNLHDARKRGEISLAQQKKKSLILIAGSFAYTALMLAPAFFWPEHFLKMIIAMGLLTVVVGSVQSLVQWRKKRAACVAAESEKINSEEDSI